MDIRMPGLAGLDALTIIHASNPSLPVILFTAQPDLTSAVEALRRGATDYLLKPLKPDTIIERTKSILAIQQKEQRRRELQAQIEALQAELKNLDASDEAQTAPAVQAAAPSDRFLKRGALLLDLHTYRVTIHERVVSLSSTSFDYCWCWRAMRRMWWTTRRWSQRRRATRSNRARRRNWRNGMFTTSARQSKRTATTQPS